MSDDQNIPRSDHHPDIPHPRFATRIYGHDAIIADFVTAAQGKLHHAWLISGPNGIGKATIAWRLAKTMIAGGSLTPDLPLDGDARVLGRIDALAEPRLISVTRPYDDKAKRLKTAITIDEIRKLKGFFTLSVPDGGWRVAIIDAADEMNPAASNALLKLLEEPPEQTLLLLVCHQPAKLLPTIRSRTRLLRAHPLNAGDLGDALAQTGRPIDAQQGELAQLAQGSVGMALRLLDQDGLAIYQKMLSLMAQPTNLDRVAVNNLANHAQGAQNQAQYALICDLFQMLLARLARFGASQPADFQNAAQGEARCFAQLAPNPASALKWADLLSRIMDEITRAQTVNLDPAQVILDMFLQFEATAKT